MPHIDRVNFPEESCLPHPDQPDHHRVSVRHLDPRWAKATDSSLRSGDKVSWVLAEHSASGPSFHSDRDSLQSSELDLIL